MICCVCGRVYPEEFRVTCRWCGMTPLCLYRCASPHARYLCENRPRKRNELRRLLHCSSDDSDDDPPTHLADSSEDEPVDLMVGEDKASYSLQEDEPEDPTILDNDILNEQDGAKVMHEAFSSLMEAEDLDDSSENIPGDCMVVEDKPHFSLLENKPEDPTILEDRS